MRDVFEQEISLQYQYKESRGTHNWYYWNRSLADVLEFFGFLVKTDIYN
jgi:S-formylglutathione hydrolase FrmB